MSTESTGRNFATFYLGDNVYELAGGVIPEIAARLDVRLGEEPNSADLQAIMDVVGKNKVLRHNEEVTAIDRTTMADMIEGSGIQSALNRSLVTPELKAAPENIDGLLIVGATSNWQDRAEWAVPDNVKGLPVYTVGGLRIMDTATEVTNPNIKAMHTKLGRYPEEAKYIGEIVGANLTSRGHNVIPQEPGMYQSEVGDELLEEFFRNNPELVDKRIAIVRNANAGVLMAIQMRAAARRVDPSFDSRPDYPQTFVITDGFSVARTDEQERRSSHYQKTSPALRQLVLTSKKLHEAAGGE